MEPPQEAIWFAQWQILHIRANHDEESRYGTPDFASARKAYKMMTDGEHNIAVNRKFWAQRTLVHILEGASSSDIEAYKLNNQRTLDNPFEAAADYFTNQSGGIQTLPSGGSLGDIKDILHHLSTWSAASPVPIELLGYGENVNSLAGDVLKHKLAQYQDTLETERTWVESEILKPLINLQWMLQGILPEHVDYAIQWQPKKRVDPALLAQMGQAISQIQATGLVSDMYLMKLLAEVVPSFDEATLLADYEARQNSLPDEINRFAQNVAQDEVGTNENEV